MSGLALATWAALVLARRPDNVIGWTLALVGMAAAAIFTLTWYALTFPDAALSRHAEAGEGVSVIIQFAGILALMHLFPSGRPLSPLHAGVVAALVGWAAVFAVVAVVQPGPLLMTGRPNPFGIEPPWLREVFDVGIAGVPVFAVLGVWALLVRHRRGGPVERTQLRWFFAGAGLLLAFLGLGLFLPEFSNPAAENLARGFAVLAFWSLPAAVVVAITRHGLFEIDRIISRTVTYSIVGGLLVLVYAVGSLRSGPGDRPATATTPAGTGPRGHHHRRHRRRRRGRPDHAARRAAAVAAQRTTLTARYRFSSTQARSSPR